MKEEKFNRYFVCYLDVLGFETLFIKEGLESILNKYLNLVNLVVQQNEATKTVFDKIEMSESAYWSSEGEVFVFSKLFGTYASDSMLLFSYADFPENRFPQLNALSDTQRIKRMADTSTSWLYQTIPCDYFLDLCNEVVCRSIEIGLPVRGGLALGEAVLNIDNGVYLGKPLIDAVRMDGAQNSIGISFVNSFINQTIPGHYLFGHESHMKVNKGSDIFSGFVLDWPRHWDRTRKHDVIPLINRMDTDKKYSEYYENAIEIVNKSRNIRKILGDKEERRIRVNYKQFSYSDLKVSVRAFREVLLE